MPMSTDSPKKVIIGMSGGVDSSVACFLLQEQGFEVIGVSLWTAANSQQALLDAAAVCAQLNVQHHVLDIRQEFRQLVIDDFVKAWLAGLTPNPCVKCNQQIKFAQLVQFADQQGADFVATGHYAAVRSIKGRLALARTPADIKDQTYFLYRLSQEQLARLILPLAELDKEKVRQLAQAAGLANSHGQPVASQPDSQDICFIDSGYLEFLQEEIIRRDQKADLQLLQPGEVVDQAGQVIGSHKGLLAYTIGQRKGFSVKTTERLFVLGRDFKNNRLIVGPFSGLAQAGIQVTDLVYSGLAGFSAGQPAQAKLRSSARLVDCQIWPLGPDLLKVQFAEPVMTATPGQSCVFYDNDLILAGGLIRNFSD